MAIDETPVAGASVGAGAGGACFATIVAYGSNGVSSTSGVPSAWQNRIESSNVFSQVGHFFIASVPFLD